MIRQKTEREEKVFILVASLQTRTGGTRPQLQRRVLATGNSCCPNQNFSNTVSTRTVRLVSFIMSPLASNSPSSLYYAAVFLSVVSSILRISDSRVEIYWEEHNNVFISI